jgi:phosphate transport system permease protein
MNPAFLKKIRRNDRIARWVITLGGLAIIFSVVLILILIAKVSLPLFGSSDVELLNAIKLEDGNRREIIALGADEYKETAYVIDDDGRVRFFNLLDGSPLDDYQLQPVAADAQLKAVESYGRHNQALAWDDGTVTVEQIKFYPHFDAADDNNRSIRHTIERLAEFSAPENGVVQLSQTAIGEERKVRADLLEDGRLHLQIVEEHESFLGDAEVVEEVHYLTPSIDGSISALTLTTSGDRLFVGSDRGELLRYDLSDMAAPVLIEQIQAFDDQRAITALRMVFGDVSVAVGDAEGMLTTWFAVRDDVDSSWTLQRIHDLHQHESPIEEIVTTLTDKSVISIAADGIKYSHMTSERLLAELDSPEHLTHFALTSRSDGLLAVTEKGTLLFWQIDAPHPEISFKTLFGKVWYEGYQQPEYVWQSSSGSDDYEPKLSLTPLIFGTLKGTFYAMFFAIPLAILGAIYVSQFARPKFKGFVKPAVEIMAAVPTVIIGFLAALWLAPLIERSLGSLFLSLIMIPAALMIAIGVWQVVRRNETLKRVEKGYEFIAIAPVIILAVAIAAGLGAGAEGWLFNGNLQQWMFSEMGTRYDPRNCIIIAFAMGFAVIPIIFTIAEDALSNVPPALKAASLALGASRWQTVARVILPSASPGIFAGIMIGFGRAVGETMIVLMATGNTAIMDLSIFNGMRPLSANIAVEIPEAPVDGSLYRTLFLSAVILFVMTFIVNTLAEIVRQRLRAKYGRF